MPEEEKSAILEKNTASARLGPERERSVPLTTIFVHGLGQTPAAWNGVLRRLSLEDPQCADLPALLNGQTALYETLRRNFEASCQAASEGPADLCGLSLGAVLALDYALRNPGRVRSLALIAPQYKMPRLLLKLQNAAFRRLPKRSFAQMGFSREDFLSLTGSMAALDFTDQLPGLTCRTLILTGEKDKANRKAAQSLSGLLPQAECEEIPGTGHEVNLDAPEALAQRLSRFFGLSGSGG